MIHIKKNIVLHIWKGVVYGISKLYVPDAERSTLKEKNLSIPGEPLPVYRYSNRHYTQLVPQGCPYSIFWSSHREEVPGM